MVDGSGKPDERDSSNAQFRTLLEEQRQMIIEEYREKVGHHELPAAHAEEERRLLREELWRQKLEFREVHQQSLTEMEELRKNQSSTFDTIARRKLIEDQNTIFELSGRVRSGNSHVTSRPVSFPPHPIPEGLLRQSFVSPRRKEGPPSIWAPHGISGNVFANTPASSSAPYPQELNQQNALIEEPFHTSTMEKSEWRTQNHDLRCQSGPSGPSAKDSVIFSGGDSFKELWSRPSTTADFWSSLWQVPYTSNLCLLEDKIQDRDIYLFTIPHRSNAMDQRIGVGWFSGWFKIFVIYSWYFNAEFWSSWCEDCFSTEQHHP